MDCQWIAQQLPELLQGTLDRQTEQRVLAHLAQCEDCRRELAFWAQVSQVMQAQAQKLPWETSDAVAERLGLRTQPTLRETLSTVQGALRLTGSAVRLALTLAHNP